jgi:hypothetical protein
MLQIMSGRQGGQGRGGCSPVVLEVSKVETYLCTARRYVTKFPAEDVYSPHTVVICHHTPTAVLASDTKRKAESRKQ